METSSAQSWCCSPPRACPMTSSPRASICRAKSSASGESASGGTGCRASRSCLASEIWPHTPRRAPSSPQKTVPWRKLPLAGIPDMNHSSLPPVLLSEPRALQLAVPPVRNRRQGGLELPALLIPRAPGRATLGYPASETPPPGRSVPHLPPSVPRPLDQVGCHASRSMRPRICPNRCRVKWLSASWRMKYRACRMRRPPVLKSRCWRLVRPALDGERQDQPAQVIAEVVGDDPEEQPHLVGPEPGAGEPGPVVASLPSLIHCSAVPRWL